MSFDESISPEEGRERRVLVPADKETQWSSQSRPCRCPTGKCICLSGPCAKDLAPAFLHAKAHGEPRSTMIDVFRIKEALREIGKENRVYGQIFEHYEQLERQIERLQKKLARALKHSAELQKKLDDSEEARAQAAAEHAANMKEKDVEVEKLQEEIRKLKKKMEKMVPKSEVGDGASKDQLAQLQKEMERRLRENDEKWMVQMQKVKQELAEYKRELSMTDDKYKGQIASIKQGYEEEIARLKKEVESLRAEMEKKDQEIATLRNKPGDWDQMNKGKLEMVARKKGWDVKLIKFFVREEELDVEALRKQLQDALEEAKQLRAELEMLRAHGGGGSGSGAEIGNLQSSLAAEKRASVKLGSDLEAMKRKNIDLEDALKREKAEVARLLGINAELEDIIAKLRADLAGIDGLREENAQLKVALEEMRLRLAKLSQLAGAKGKAIAKEVSGMMQDAGLSFGGMQEWLLQNVFERLYNDALARHKRFEERCVAAQKLWASDTMQRPEVYRLGGITGRGGHDSTLRPESPQQEVSQVVMTWASVVYPDDDGTLRKARARVHELLSDQQGSTVPRLPMHAPDADSPVHSLQQVKLGRGLPEVSSGKARVCKSHMHRHRPALPPAMQDSGLRMGLVKTASDTTSSMPNLWKAYVTVPPPSLESTRYTEAGSLPSAMRSDGFLQAGRADGRHHRGGTSGANERGMPPRAATAERC